MNPIKVVEGFKSIRLKLQGVAVQGFPFSLMLLKNLLLTKNRFFYRRVVDVEYNGSALNSPVVEIDALLAYIPAHSVKFTTGKSLTPTRYITIQHSTIKESIL